MPPEQARAPASAATGSAARGGAPEGQARGARRGGYYLDDGPGDAPLPDLDAIADAVPRAEPIAPRATRPYVVFDRQYVPMTALAPFRERGVASWYGRRYHGQRTSIGEVYDMYAMTGAHPTLPLPSYVRVTHLGNGRSVTVRLNDRGPFLNNRVIDLSYVAAAKLGYVEAGSAEVEVELITRFDHGTASRQAGSAPPAASAPGMASAATAPAVAQASSAPAVAPASGAPAVAPASSAPAVAPAATVAGAAPALAAAPAAPPVRLEFETVETPASPPAPAPASVPASVPASAPAVAASSVAAPPGGYFVQLGAFTSQDNALAARGRVAQAAAVTPARLAVRQEGGLHKLRYGPFAARDEAIEEARRIRALTGSAAFVVDR
ncbi:MAG TPA: septal ring lytic transglycosylase RlpA family protein [Burkholderiaceae bacterium]